MFELRHDVEKRKRQYNMVKIILAGVLSVSDILSIDIGGSKLMIGVVDNSINVICGSTHKLLRLQ
jgi:hypothetical protein